MAHTGAERDSSQERHGISDEDMDRRDTLGYLRATEDSAIHVY